MPGRGRSAELQLDESPYAGLSSFQESGRRQVLRPQPRDRGHGHAHPRSAADGRRRQLGRRQVVVRARRPRARAQALGRAVGDARDPPGSQADGGARRDRRTDGRDRGEPRGRDGRAEEARRQVAQGARPSRSPPARPRPARQPAHHAVRRSVRGALHPGAGSRGARGIHRVPVGGRRRCDEPAARRAVDPLGLSRPCRRGPAVRRRADPGVVLPRAAEPHGPARRDPAARRARRLQVRARGHGRRHARSPRDHARRTPAAPVRGEQAVGERATSRGGC